MSIPRIIAKVYREPWSVLPEIHAAIRAAIEAKTRGESPAVIVRAGEDFDNEVDHPRNVAVIPVYGIIGKHLSDIEMLCGGCSLDTIQDQIRLVADDDDIDHVLFDFHSPGGTVTGVPETADQIADLANVKNTWAFTDSVCASAAYWMASQCTTILATKSAVLGSIGVRAYYEDISRHLKNQGIEPIEFSSGKYKTMGADWRPMTDEEKAMIQRRIDQIGADFRSDVSAKREMDPKYMEGQVFSGKEAVGIGMADALVKGIDDAIERLVA